ncbi:hypothetical protein DPMN_104250 [Dreissena polymorpha]|uniref:Uncharacterized protein n=1 Tax=Dreissena polymorpha TaxID=45954 RepID=A0A9D4K0Z7_DREPO|nr:hypothetical protein DPMN_104250 [Dreissena polymorpha]
MVARKKKLLKYDEVGGGPKKAQSRGKSFNRFRELNDAQFNHGEVGGPRAKTGFHVPSFDDVEGLHEEEVDHSQVGGRRPNTNLLGASFGSCEGLNDFEGDILKISTAKDKKNTTLVAAIDIGTSGCFYAFQYQREIRSGITDPTKVFTNQNWVAGSMSVVSLKAPTVVLFKDNGTFHSFGYEAENNYSELALDD